MSFLKYWINNFYYFKQVINFINIHYIMILDLYINNYLNSKYIITNKNFSFINEYEKTKIVKYMQNFIPI
jgi:hypothetical protein